MKLLLVEDDKSLGETLKERLELEGFEIKWTKNIGSAKEVVKKFRPDLAVLDVRLPDGTGFDLVEFWKNEKFKPAFIFLTSQANAEDRLKGYELGAEEFIPKPFHLKELILRIHHVLGMHKHTIKKETIVVQEYLIDFEKQSIRRKNQNECFLSKREASLLHLLIENKNKIVSRDEILTKLWGDEKFPTNRTIDNVIVKLRQYFGDSKVELIKSIRGIGYMWLGD